MPSSLGRPRSSTTRSGTNSEADVERGLAVARRPHLVALHAQRALEDLGDLARRPRRRARGRCGRGRSSRPRVDASLKPRSRSLQGGSGPVGVELWPDGRQEALCVPDPQHARRPRAPQAAEGAPRGAQSRAALARRRACRGCRDLEQRHLDLLGLACVAHRRLPRLPALPQRGRRPRRRRPHRRASSNAIGALRFGAPPAIVAIGALLVMRPVLPIVKPVPRRRPLPAPRLALGLAAGHAEPRPGRHARRPLGARLRRSTAAATSARRCSTRPRPLLGTIGAHIVALFLFVAALLLLTGASIAGVVKATSTGVIDTTRTLKPRREPVPEVAPRSSAWPRRSRRLEPEDDVVVVTRRAPALDGRKRFSDLFEDEPAKAIGPAARGRARARSPIPSRSRRQARGAEVLGR